MADELFLSAGRLANHDGAVTLTDLDVDTINGFPLVEPATLLDSATLTSNFDTTTPIPQIGTIALVTGTVVDVPDIDQTVILRGHAPVQCLDASNISLILGIVPAGGVYGDRVEEAHGISPNLSIPFTLTPELELPPNSPGQYQLFLSTLDFSARNMRVAATATQKAWLQVWAV